MTSIIAQLNSFRRKRREENARQRRAYIEQSFQVEERAGEIIITKDGVAINHFQRHASADEIVAALQTTRTTAIKFSSHDL